MTFDLQRSKIISVSVDGNHENEIGWRLAQGSLASRQEAIVLQTVFGGEAISAVYVLDQVARDQLKIYTITPENVDETANMIHSAAASDSVKKAAAKGWSAICPKYKIQIGNWYGMGWVEWDPSTGDARFLIIGTVDEDVMTPNIMGGAITDKGLLPLLAKGIGLGLLDLHDLGALAIGIYGPALCGIGIAMALDAGLATYLLGLWAFGGLALLFGFCLGITLIGHMHHMPGIIQRRKEEEK